MPFKTKIDWDVEVWKALEYGKTGKTLREIGALYGVSRQRIKQVFQKYKIDPQDVGIKIRTNKSREEAAAAHWKKWGAREDTDTYHLQRSRYRAKKANASRKGIPFTIMFSEIDWPTHCPILGMELDYYAERRQENSPTFDKVISNLGYVSGNTYIISARANRIKNDGSLEEHKLIVNYIEKACTLS